jgi:hypothetical protein
MTFEGYANHVAFRVTRRCRILCQVKWFSIGGRVWAFAVRSAVRRLRNSGPVGEPWAPNLGRLAPLLTRISPVLGPWRPQRGRPEFIGPATWRNRLVGVALSQGPFTVTRRLASAMAAAFSPKRCSVGTSSANPANTTLKMWTTSRPPSIMQSVDCHMREACPAAT